MSSFVLAADAACDLNIKLLNQDPYPAVPGEIVKVVFQVDGISSAECGDVEISLAEEFPFTFDESSEKSYSIKAGTFTKNYDSSFQIPFKLRVNEDAIDGENKIEIAYTVRGDSGSEVTEDFMIEVKDVKADFEVYVKDYDYKTNEVTLEILNIEESDVEALAVEIPKQDIIQVKGPNRVVVGDLDSNEYTTADFEAIPSDGEFMVNLVYSDTINTRRNIEKIISFDSSYFKDRKADQKTTSTTTYVIWIIIISFLAWWTIKKFKKKKN